jgi:serine/threonine-protein kinase
MSPEQLDGAAIDRRADLFSAGVVLYEALVGRRLFLGTNQLETASQVRSARIEPPSRDNPRVPPALDAVVMRALARDREARFQSGAEMAVALDEVVHELRFGPEKLAELLRTTFGDGATTRMQAAATVVSDRPRMGRRPRTLLLASAAAAALSATTTALVLHRRHARAPLASSVAASAPASAAAPRSTPASAAASAPAPAASVSADAPHAPASATAGATTAATAPATVKVRVSSIPPGATVFVGAARTPRGTTPLTLALPSSHARTRLELSAPRYQPAVTDVVPEADTQLVLALVPQPPPAAASARPPAHHDTHAPKKPSPATGDLADPFARR